ncbi:MAG: RagB/SusD family nutrient uptake outer membrane protein [Candidatus Cryptobacteroides sp.]
MTNFTRYNIKAATMALALLVFSSCLEKYPEEAIPEEKAITTVDEANQFVLGIYADYKSSALYSGLLTLLPDIQSDLVYAVDGYSNTYGDVWRWEILATNNEITSVWAALYNVIGDCNFFFDYEPSLRASLTSDDDVDSLNELCGEVHFARALAYSELIKCFCKAYEPGTADKELGVILVDSYHNPGKITRSSLKESYEFVLADLAKAEEGLTLEGVYSSVYFNKSLVNALYARNYLYMQDWDKAIEYSTKVIEDDALKLSSASTKYTSSQSYYDYMWTNDLATEVIWRIGFTTTSYGGALGRVFLNYNYAYYTPDYVPAKWALNLYSNKDLRYNAFFTNITTGYSHGLTWPLLIKYYGNETFLQSNILHVNMPKVFRLSEQYLIRAEAKCRKGEFGSAAKDITTLRTARYSDYGSTSLSADNWLQTISDERVRELFMEGFRLQDLKRWHKGFERTPQTSSVAKGSSLKIEADDPLFVWPIPQHELNSPGSDVQPNESNR